MTDRIQRVAILIGVTLLMSAALIGYASQEPSQALWAMLVGPFTSVAGDATRLGVVIEDAVTLSLLGLAVAFGFRARQFSMGADGQMLLAALAGSWVSFQFSSLGFIAALAGIVAAVAVGFAWGWLPGMLKARAGANEIVTTIMLNVIAIQFYRFAITNFFKDPSAGYVATPAVSSAAMLSPLLSGTHVTLFVVTLPLAAFAAWWLLERTVWGYEIRVVGEAPAFARHSGIPQRRAIVLSMAFGGAFAGLAGFHLSHSLLPRLPADLNAGLGFEGLLIALLARCDPRAIPFVALFYAYLRAGAQVMERTTDVSHELALVIQALVVLVAISDGLVRRLADGFSRSKSGR